MLASQDRCDNANAHRPVGLLEERPPTAQALDACDCVTGTSASINSNFDPKVAVAPVFSSTGMDGALNA